MECGTRSQRDSGVRLHARPNVDAPKRIGLLLFSGFAFPEAATVLEMFRSRRYCVGVTPSRLRNRRVRRAPLPTPH